MSDQPRLFADETPPPQPAITRTVKAHLDELLDWYDKNMPDVRRVPVACVRSTAQRFAKPAKRGGKQLFYRGREIVPTRKPRGEPE